MYIFSFEVSASRLERQTQGGQKKELDIYLSAKIAQSILVIKKNAQSRFGIGHSSNTPINGLVHVRQVI